MAAEKKSGGIKSALDLAMERMAESQGPGPTLTQEQKEALAEVEKELQAKVAELEIMTRQRVVEAGARGDLEKASELESEKAVELKRLRRLADTKKENVRQKK